MNRYKINFWYHTDLRYTWTGEALNEEGALYKAKESQQLDLDWCENVPFRIEILAD